MKALTLIQPWGWAIAHGFKPIENRVWAPPATLREFAIHAGKGREPEAWRLPAMRAARDATTDESWDIAGAVIGVAAFPGMGDAVRRRPMWHWEVTGRPLAAPVPCRGLLGLWDLPADVEAAVRAQLGGEGW